MFLRTKMRSVGTVIVLSSVTFVASGCHNNRAPNPIANIDSKQPDKVLFDRAMQAMREVQEVLAELEYRVARFYASRDSFAAAIARLRSLIDAYPLYSQADDALFLLGQTYQRQADLVRAGAANAQQETTKANMIRKIEDLAATAYDRIIERYPAGGRKDDAIARLKSLNRPVPTPTAEALAQSKAEEESRSDTTRMTRIMSNFHRGPDVAHATKVGEPPLEDA